MIDYFAGDNFLGDCTKYVAAEAINGLTNVTLGTSDGNTVILQFDPKTYEKVHQSDETAFQCTPGCTAWNPSPSVSLGERQVYQCGAILKEIQPVLPQSVEVCPKTHSLIRFFDSPSKITQFFKDEPNDCVSTNTGKVCFDNSDKDVFILIAGGVMISVVVGAGMLTFVGALGFTKKYLFEQRQETKEAVSTLLSKCSFGLFGSSAHDEAPDEEIGDKTEERNLLPK